MNLISLITGPILDGFKTVMDEIRLSPEKKAELQQRMSEMQAAALQADRDLESKLAETAGQNIRAEAGSGDKYTSRARPTFLYVVNTILGWNYIIVPLFHRDPIALPEPLFWLFGSVMLGYVGARTWEKVYGQK